MEASDRELILKVLESNRQLKRLYDEHLFLESELQTMEHRIFLTPQEEIAEKQLKLRKLRGVDQMMQILAKHRAQDAGAGEYSAGAERVAA